MRSDSNSNKTPYFPPAIAKLSLKQAKEYLTCHANYRDQEAAEFLESLRREQIRIEKLSILRRG
jgi:Rps23 Pro-64 3,4-dihydroxylase Tpa1-like proline 4-hydroxylase